MIIGNAKVFIDGKFVPGSVALENGIITAIGNETAYDVDARGQYLVPGFVDVHSHGAMGGDFSDGKAEDMEKLSRYYAQNGVTSYLATTMTLKEHTLIPPWRSSGILSILLTVPNVPVSTWKARSCATTSGALRRLRTCTCRMQRCSPG